MKFYWVTSICHNLSKPSNVVQCLFVAPIVVGHYCRVDMFWSHWTYLHYFQNTLVKYSNCTKSKKLLKALIHKVKFPSCKVMLTCNGGWKKMTPKGIIRRCGLVEISVALLEEVCCSGGGLWGLFCSSFPQYGTQSTSCCLQDVGLSVASLAPSLPACCHAPPWW